MKNILILLTLILFSCESAFDFDDMGKVDPILQPYLDKFFEEASMRGVKLPNKIIKMEIKELDYGNGHCDWFLKRAYVFIDPTKFEGDFYTYNHYMEAVIFHELGHGLLNRHHMDHPGGIEYSLMSVPQTGRPTWVDGSMRDYYLNELFRLM